MWDEKNLLPNQTLLFSHASKKNIQLPNSQEGLWLFKLCPRVLFDVQLFVLKHMLFKKNIFIPKLFLRLLWFFRRTATLFRQIRTFPQLFRFCSDLGNPGIRQIVRDSMLTGRWWEGRILIDLCGKNNVRNCDLLQSDFFARVGPS